MQCSVGALLGGFSELGVLTFHRRCEGKKKQGACGTQNKHRPHLKHRWTPLILSIFNDRYGKGI